MRGEREGWRREGWERGERGPERGIGREGGLGEGAVQRYVHQPLHVTRRPTETH